MKFQGITTYMSVKAGAAMLQPFSFESFFSVNSSLFGTIALYLLILCFFYDIIKIVIL